MTRIVHLEQIKSAIEGASLIPLIEQGFAAYSRGEAVVPPVGELLFDDPPGEAHIKYGYIRGGAHYVIKVASGFQRNRELGLPTGLGLMLVFSQKSGVLEAVLLDDGYLTDLRTAVAGAVAAKHLAPKSVHRVGILGAGAQGRLQLLHLGAVTSCREALVWTPRREEEGPYREALEGSGFEIVFAADAAEVAREANLIVTTTPSEEPLLMAGDIRPGTHITAVGSDTASKIELDPNILALADVVVVDSLSQSEKRGEVFRAVAAGRLSRSRVIELGSIIDGAPARRDETQVSVADLTGVAVQDIQIAQAVLSNLS